MINIDFYERYKRAFDQTWSDDTPIDAVRFVVVDSETTGFNPRTDRIVTIGAVGVRNGEIVIEDSFEALLRISRNTDAVKVHGVTRTESRKGMEEPEALQRFLEYLQDGVVVGHHIGHDLEAFDAACERHWGFHLSNRFIDTMTLMLHLVKDGAFAGRPAIPRYSLDALCEVFGVIPYDRHTASGDAFITAQIFLRMRRLALRCGRATLGRLSEPFEENGDSPL